MSVCDEGKTWTDFTIYREEPTTDTIDGGELLISSYDSGDITGERRKDDENQGGFTGTCVPPTGMIDGTLDFYITINDRLYHFEGTTQLQSEMLDIYVATGTYMAVDLKSKANSSEAVLDAIDPGDSGTWEGHQGGG